MKTTLEWFNELNDKYKENALRNMINPDHEHYSLAGAVSNGFVWENTPEGKSYWNGVFREIMYGEKFEPNTTNQISVVKSSNDVLISPSKKTQKSKNKESENVITNDQIFDNQIKEHKVENDIDPDNSISKSDEDNLFKQYKLEKDNSK